VDNWGEIGFKIKTYEIDPDDDSVKYLVDMIEGNELIPNLKCTAPCKECKEVGGEVVDMEYCTACWQNKPQKYLYTSSSTVSICDDECPDGWTTNGDPNHACVKCDSSC